MTVPSSVCRHPGGDLDEGGLPGSVLPDQGMDLAGAALEVDVRERSHSREGLRHSANIQDRISARGECPRPASPWLLTWCRYPFSRLVTRGVSGRAATGAGGGPTGPAVDDQEPSARMAASCSASNSVGTGAFAGIVGSKSATTSARCRTRVRHVDLLVHVLAVLQHHAGSEPDAAVPRAPVRDEALNLDPVVDRLLGLSQVRRVDHVGDHDRRGLAVLQIRAPRSTPSCSRRARPSGSLPDAYKAVPSCVMPCGVHWVKPSWTSSIQPRLVPSVTQGCQTAALPLPGTPV